MAKRDDKGRIVAGTGALNPGGLTKDAKQAAEALNAWLRSDEVSTVGKGAYLDLLRDGNPVIAKDFMDRVAGKARDVVEVKGGADPLATIDAARLLAALDVLKGAE